MGDDYRSDLERFLDGLDDLAMHREAASQEQHAMGRKRVDLAVKKTKGLVNDGLFDTESALREFVIERLKALGKLPPQFNYSDEPSR